MEELTTFYCIIVYIEEYTVNVLYVFELEGQETQYCLSCKKCLYLPKEKKWKSIEQLEAKDLIPTSQGMLRVLHKPERTIENIKVPLFYLKNMLNIYFQQGLLIQDLNLDKIKVFIEFKLKVFAFYLSPNKLIAQDKEEEICKKLGIFGSTNKSILCYFDRTK